MKREAFVCLTLGAALAGVLFIMPAFGQVVPPGGQCTNCLRDDGGFNVVGNYLPLDGGTVYGAAAVQRGLRVESKDGGAGLTIATGTQFSVSAGLVCGADENYCNIRLGGSGTALQGSSTNAFLFASNLVNFNNGLTGARTNGASFFVGAGNYLDGSNNKAAFTTAAKNPQLIQSNRAALTADALVVTFATAFSAAPQCTATCEGDFACHISTAASTTGVTFTCTGAGTAQLNWICIGDR